MIQNMGPMKYPLAFGVTGLFGLLVGTFLATLFAMLDSASGKCADMINQSNQGQSKISRQETSSNRSFVSDTLMHKLPAFLR